MSCNSCNENNTIPLQIPVTDPCNPCETPCTDCNSCECTCADPGYLNDGCYATQVTDCTTYEGNALVCAEIESGDTLTSVLNNLYGYAKNTVNRLSSDSLSITVTNDACDDKATIELVPSTDADNTLILGTDGLPYVPAPDLSAIGDSPELVATDSSTIDFTQSGTLGHSITAAVKLSATANNALVLDSGLYVNGALFSPVLTFNNGLTKTGTTVKLGGSLLADTLLVLDTNELNITGSVSGISSTTTLTNAGFTNGSFDVASDEYCLLSNQYNLFVVENKTVGLNPVAYLANGQLAVRKNATILGHAFPTSNDIGTPAPSASPFLTSYVMATDGRVDAYASYFKFLAETNTQTSGAIVSGRRYEILSNGGGADFTPSGAANNTVGTIFVSNGVTPTWGSGSLELLGLFRSDAKEASFSGQVLVGGSSQTKSAQFEVQSITKGSIPFPKMTATQKAALTPIDGLAIYQTDGTNGVYVYDGTATAWKKLTWA